MVDDHGTKEILSRFVSKKAPAAPLAATVFVFGEARSGKKSLVAGMLRAMGQNSESISQIDNIYHNDLRKKYEHIYIADYRYMRVGGAEGSGSEELGTLNIYLVNEPLPLFSMFLDANSLRNFAAVVVLDLSQPEALTDSFVRWTGFFSEQLFAHLGAQPPAAAVQLRDNYELFLRRNRQIGGDDAASPEAGLGFPLLLVGSKHDLLERLDANVAQAAVATMRNLALKHGAALVFASEAAGTNLRLLGDYLAFALLGREEPPLSPCLNAQGLFLPALFAQDEAALSDLLHSTASALRSRRSAPQQQAAADEEAVQPYQEFLDALLDRKSLAPAGPSERFSAMLKKSELPTTQKRSVLIKRLLDGFDNPRQA